MMETEKLTFKVSARLCVPDETAERCLRLLEMYLDDNQDKQFLAERELMDDGSFRTKMKIVSFGRNHYDGKKTSD